MVRKGKEEREENKKIKDGEEVRKGNRSLFIINGANFPTALTKERKENRKYKRRGGKCQTGMKERMQMIQVKKSIDQ